MDRENEKFVELDDLSGGAQNRTTEFLQQNNELSDAQNARYDTVGGVKPAEGYEQVGNDATSTTSTSTSTSTTTTSTSTSTTSTSSTTTSSSTSTTTSTSSSTSTSTTTSA